MLLNTSPRRVESTIVGQTTSFKIEASAKAFAILSSNLYSDPMLAFIRELLTNAWDAHTRVGAQDTPIKVHLPSNFSSEFRVRDFGPGISQFGIHSLYSTYFASDKSGSNSEIGGLGLGSKSPLSYTDQFQVHSYQDGLKSTYLVFISEDGTPKVSDLDRQPTEEPDGFEVIVPVAQSDRDAMITRYADFVHYMPVQPDCAPTSIEGKGKEVLRVIETITDPQFPDWTLEALSTPTQYGYGNGKVTLVMGIVPYTLTNSQLSNMDDLYEQLYCTIRVPVGTFEVSPSRESLSLKQVDYGRLSLLATTLRQRLGTLARRRVESSANAIELIQNYWDVTGETLFSGLPKGTKFHWKGYTLPEDIGAGISYYDKPGILPVPLPEGLTGTSFRNIPRGTQSLRLIASARPFPRDGVRTNSTAVPKPTVVFWSEQPRAFRHMITDGTVDVRDRDLIWHLVGPRSSARTWASMYGLALTDVTKPPKKVAKPKKLDHDGDPIPASSFDYKVVGPDGEYTAKLEEILATENFVVYGNDAFALPDNGNWGVLQSYMTSAPLVVTIPPSHSRVRKLLIEKAAYKNWQDYVDQCLDVGKHAELYASQACTQQARQFTFGQYLDRTFDDYASVGKGTAEQTNRLADPLHLLYCRYEMFKRLVLGGYWVVDIDTITTNESQLAEHARLVEASSRSWKTIFDCTTTYLEEVFTQFPALRGPESSQLQYYSHYQTPATPPEIFNAYLNARTSHHD